MATAFPTSLHERDHKRAMIMRVEDIAARNRAIAIREGRNTVIFDEELAEIARDKKALRLTLVEPA